MVKNAGGDLEKFDCKLIRIGGEERKKFIAYMEMVSVNKIDARKGKSFTDMMWSIGEGPEELNQNQRKAISEVLERNKEVFSENPGLLKGYEHEIKTVDHKPFKDHSYPIPYSLRDQVQEVINDMVTEGIIERTENPYNNSICIVKK